MGLDTGFGWLSPEPEAACRKDSFVLLWTQGVPELGHNFFIGGKHNSDHKNAQRRGA